MLRILTSIFANSYCKQNLSCLEDVLISRRTEFSITLPAEHSISMRPSSMKEKSQCCSWNPGSPKTHWVRTCRTTLGHVDWGWKEGEPAGVHRVWTPFGRKHTVGSTENPYQNTQNVESKPSVSAHLSSFALFMSRSANFTSAPTSDLLLSYLVNTQQSLIVIPTKVSNTREVAALSALMATAGSCDASSFTDSGTDTDKASTPPFKLKVLESLFGRTVRMALPPVFFVQYVAQHINLQ